MTFKEFCQRHQIEMLKGAFQSWLVEHKEFCSHIPEEWERLYAQFEYSMTKE